MGRQQRIDFTDHEVLEQLPPGVSAEMVPPFVVGGLKAVVTFPITLIGGVFSFIGVMGLLAGSDFDDRVFGAVCLAVGVTLFKAAKKMRRGLDKLTGEQGPMFQAMNSGMTVDSPTEGESAMTFQRPRPPDSGSDRPSAAGSGLTKTGPLSSGLIGQSSTGASAGAAWYFDPDRTGWLRWWDGAAWTDDVAPADPMDRRG